MNIVRIVVTMCMVLAIASHTSAQGKPAGAPQDLDALKQRLTELERSMADQIAALRQQIAAIETPFLILDGEEEEARFVCHALGIEGAKLAGKWRKSPAACPFSSFRAFIRRE